MKCSSGDEGSAFGDSIASSSQEAESSQQNTSAVSQVGWSAAVPQASRSAATGDLAHSRAPKIPNQDVADTSANLNQDAPSRSFGITLIRAVLWLVGLCGVALAVYLSLRRSPWLMSIPWIPRWLSNWCDHHGAIRNFPAFVAMALPFLFALRRASTRAWMMIFLAVLAAGLELAQRFIPTRVADMRDVYSSWAGLLVAWVVIEGIRFSATWLRRKFGARKSAA